MSRTPSPACRCARSARRACACAPAICPARPRAAARSASRRCGGKPRRARRRRSAIALDLGEQAEHGHAADRLAEIVGARRQDAGRAQIAHRAGLHRADHHLDLDAAPQQQRRQRGLAHRLMARARVLEVAIGQPRPAEQRVLHQPVEGDRDLAEEEGAVEVRREQDVVDDQQAQRQDRDRAARCSTGPAARRSAISSGRARRTSRPAPA